MFAVDALGYTMYTGVDLDTHLALTSEYTSFLRRNGGVAALTIGNATASFYSQWLHGPAALAAALSSLVASTPSLAGLVDQAVAGVNNISPAMASAICTGV